jgi:hypothetical protein
MAGKVANPADIYCLDHSTDHAVAGGCAVATGPTPSGAVDESRQRISRHYLRVTDGNTFDTLYSVVGRCGTLLHLVSAGLHAELCGRAIYLSCHVPQRGYRQRSGYYTLELVDRTIGGPHLVGAGAYGFFARSYSPVGKKLFTDPRLLGHSIQKTQNLAGRLISRNHSVTFYYKEQLWWAGVVTNLASGEVPENGRTCVPPNGGGPSHLPVRSRGNHRRHRPGCVRGLPCHVHLPPKAARAT